MLLMRANMTDREAWLKAGEIVAAHGSDSARYVLRSLGDILSSGHGAEDWRRVALAVDDILATPLQ